MKKWFDISTKTPKERQEVLVAFHMDSAEEGVKQGTCYMLATYFEKQFYTFETIKIVPNVTHWMTLPKPPEEVSNYNKITLPTSANRSQIVGE